MPVDSSGQLEPAFFAGRHHQVLAQAWDGPSPHFSAQEAPYVAGSLALLGRLEEAMALATERLGDPALAPTIGVELRFFVIVGLCHSGRYAEALTWARRNATHARAPSARTRFFVLQGIALVRYFQGRIDRARRASRRSLAEAVAARFQWGRLLALDLRGHVLVQRGEVSAGLRVLGQAAHLATSVGSAGHAAAIESARLAYESQHGRRREDLDTALEHAARGNADNVYAQRSAWMELAFRRALVGDSARARAALDRAAEHALPDTDLRAQVRFFVAMALVCRLDRSRAEARAALEEAARALAAGEDRILRAELTVWSTLLIDDEAGVDLASAITLERETGSFAARALVAMRGGRELGPMDARESPLWTWLASRAPRAERVKEALQRGWLGLSVIAGAQDAGRHALFAGDTLVVDDRGTVMQIEKLPSQARELFDALRRGERTKEELVREVWHLSRYAPRRHDPVVHTAIGRLRRALGPLADWISTTADGYALLDGVEVSVLGEEGASVAVDRPTAPDALPEMILGALGERALGVAALAESVKVSEATVLRRLRTLVAAGEVTREGAGKSTRYRRTARH